MNRNHGIVDPAGLRERARDAIHGGRLPNRRPSRTWGGTGSGGCCPICGMAVARDEPEIELEFAAEDGQRGDSELRVHVHCLAAWEQALAELERGAPDSGAGAPPEPAAPRGAAAEALPVARHRGSIAARGRDERTGR